MKKFCIAIYLMAGPTFAETEGMALNLRCATFVDVVDGVVPTTASTLHYINGLIDGVAIKSGVTTPGKLIPVRGRVLRECRNDPAKKLHAVISEGDFSK